MQENTEAVAETAESPSVEQPSEAEKELAALAQEKIDAYSKRWQTYWREQRRSAKNEIARRRKADKAARKARRRNRR